MPPGNLRCVTGPGAHNGSSVNHGNALIPTIVFEVEGLIARRDAIVELVDAKIAERGELAIVYTLPR